MEHAELHTHVSNNLKDGIIDFVAGSAGGIALVYVGQPLDTIKVKMQAFPHIYSNMMDCWRTTLHADGIRKGLYAGTVPALVANITENSVLFMFYGLCQKFIQKVTNTRDVNSLSVTQNATAGSLASLFSTIALTPTELVKCKLQAAHEKRKQEEMVGKQMQRVGPWSLTKQIFRNEGTRGLFRGFVPTLAREMPGYFFFFGGYEGMRELLRRPNQKKDDIGLWRTMIAGGVGGAIFWTVIFPIDVVKSRMQINTQNENFLMIMLRICQKEGMKRLYTGLTPTLIRTFPATATLFVTYEYSKKFFYYLTRDMQVE